VSLSPADTYPGPTLSEQRTGRQQKDNLCGPFHAARALWDAGVTEFEGEPLDQDLVASRAGTVLPVRELGPAVPPGAVTWHEYRYELERVEPEQTGTQPEPLARTIEELSQGRLNCVPLTGGWDAPTVERLVGEAPAGVRLIANLRTAPLWGSRPPLEAVLAHLDGREVPDPPAPDWDVGHFVELVQVVRGRGGSFVVVHDTYPVLGWGGHHLQPPQALAGALIRDDGRGGGVLAITASDGADAVRGLAAELGLTIEFWSN
jgi:hypothetical protein